MKTQSAALAAHRLLPVTSLAWCWKCVRKDGAMFGFTSTDVAFSFDGVLYEAATGFTPTAMQQNADLSVPNMEVAGFLDSDSITEDDLTAGRWDGAAIEIFEMNYRDLSMGKMILRTGKLGNVTAGRTAFQAELRGLSQDLQQPVGEVFTAACPAALGDARCKVDLESLRVEYSLTGVGNRRSFTVIAAGQPTDYFSGGVARWESGANAGLSMEIRSFGGGVFELVLPMPYAIVVGDVVSLVPGCRKRLLEDCRDKFANVVNFRGFPHVPGNDQVLGNAGLASA